MAALKLTLPLIFVLGLICPVFGGEIQHPALDNAPRVTRTTTGMHADPINVALIGTKEELIAAMLAAKWQPADPITFKSSAKLVYTVARRRPDETAPVSNLYLWKRKEDLAFEQQVGKDASAATTSAFGSPPSSLMAVRSGLGRRLSTRRLVSATRRDCPRTTSTQTSTPTATRC